MRILAIETSCDETALAIVEAKGGLSKPEFHILGDIVASQIEIHRPFGGVVPNLAKREHIKNLPLLFEKLFKKDFKINEIDAIAVTVGPGLEPALWAGIVFAEELSKKHSLPIWGANHLEGHLYSFLLPSKSRKRSMPLQNIFPAISLIVSGGHTILLHLEKMTFRKKIGETRDDAVGEAFDKVARILQLPYPGGPEIGRLALEGKRDAISFPRPMIHDKNYDFSFSGLKTSVLYFMKDNPRANKADVAASFEEAAVDVLIKKTIRALKELKAKSIHLSGGVAANLYLRKKLESAAKKEGAKLLVADQKYNTDNAAMIATAAYIKHLQKKKYPLKANGSLGV